MKLHIGQTFVSAWLKEDGSFVFMSLQCPNADFITESINNVSGLYQRIYENMIISFQSVAEIPGFKDEYKNIKKANLVKPVIWDKGLNIITAKFIMERPSVIILRSAFNLLLFSPTYGYSILEKMKGTILACISRTNILYLSTNAKADEISKIEAVADNILISRSEKEPFRIFKKALRIIFVWYNSNEVLVPILSEILNNIKNMTDHSSRIVIPAI